MPQVEIPAPVFDAARRRAADSGFATVDEFISDLVSHQLDDNFDDPIIEFTPERLAHIDRSIAQIKAGKGLTTQQVDEELSKRREQWLKNKSGSR